MNQRIAVFGAHGFVGSAVSAALHNRGHEVVPVRTPRLRKLPGVAPTSAQAVIDAYPAEVKSLVPHLLGVDAVVNCAGNPDASSRDVGALDRANGDVVAVIAAATTHAGVPRLVHVSSAVVQGRRPVLDNTFNYDPFSAYARSKIRGEQWLSETRPEGSVIYRPPSVHARGRRVTQMTTRIARSPIASVANPPTAPTPQALLENVGDAVAFLATYDQDLPRVVTHPWEGITTARLLAVLGGKDPHVLPRALARALAGAIAFLGRVMPKIAANARRVEMIWFGQRQATSWLTAQEWFPPAVWGDQEWGHS